jgi:hypothetical protein
MTFLTMAKEQQLLPLEIHGGSFEMYSGMAQEGVNG